VAAGLSFKGSAGRLALVAQLDKEYLHYRATRAWSRLLSYAFFEGRPLTTSGRWFNPVVANFCKLLARIPFSDAPRAPVFILGAGRSGTTILGKVLSLHPDVGFLNEPKIVWHLAYANEDLNGSYTDKSAHYRLSAADATPDVAQTMQRIYRGYSAVTRNTRIVDKYPELIFRTPFVKQIFPDARFVFLIRNGTDACRSVAQWSKEFGHYDGGSSVDWWGKDDRKWLCLVNDLVRKDVELAPLAETIAAYNSHIDRAAVEWVVTMREVLALRDLNDGFYECRYESLTSDPIGEMGKLCDFCDLSSDQVMLDYAGAVLLRPRRRDDEEQLDLDPVIAPVFWQTMDALGYAKK
jgi:hypothetical protein